MSIEARSLANKINNLDLSLENTTDKAKWEEGKNAYDGIIRNIGFVLPTGLRLVENYLNDNGKLAYNKFFKKHIEAEINKSKKHGNKS